MVPNKQVRVPAHGCGVIYGMGLATANTLALYTLAILTPTRGLYASMILSFHR